MNSPPLSTGAIRKRMLLIGRRPGMSRDDFDTHWSARHPEAVMKMRNLTGYVQNPVVRSVQTGTWPPDSPVSDGLVEIWFDESVAEPLSADDLSALRQDENSFLGALTGFIVNGSSAAEEEARIWILLGDEQDTEVFDSVLGPDKATARPYDGQIITRPGLANDGAAPVVILSAATSLAAGDRLFESAVKAACDEAHGAARMLLTTTRRIV